MHSLYFISKVVTLIISAFLNYYQMSGVSYTGQFCRCMMHCRYRKHQSSQNGRCMRLASYTGQKPHTPAMCLIHRCFIHRPKASYTGNVYMYCILPSAMSSKTMYVCRYIHMCEPSLDNQITYYGRSTQSTANTQKLHINVSYNLIHQQYC